jgi:DNA replication licensing factor MCM2
VLCVVRDIVDPITDARLANAVIEAHRRRPLEKVLDEEILRKYIAYARTWCNPKLTEADNRKIVSVYAELRKESQGGGGSPITVRHLESIIRLAEAHARLHLRSAVEERDVNFAIALILGSFVSTQKYADKKAFERKFAKYLSEGRDRNDLLMHVIHTMVIEKASFYRLRRDPAEVERIIRISKADFEARAREVGVQSFHEFYSSDKFRNDFTETETDIVREN